MMKKEIFIEKKNSLIQLIQENLKKTDISKNDRISLVELLDLLNMYSYENRLEQKGLLSHTIIDSLELDYSIGEKFIQFDNQIK